MVGPSVWWPCAVCDGTGDRSKNRRYRDGWNAAQADNGALRKEIEALRGLLAAQRAATIADDRATVLAKDTVEAFPSYAFRRAHTDVLVAEVEIAIATARAQGAESMRDAILRWHEERLIYYRDLSGKNAFAGAVMFAHERSIDAILALNVDKGEQ